jgi:hypothetical protein
VVDYLPRFLIRDSNFESPYGEDCLADFEQELRPAFPVVGGFGYLAEPDDKI